jgi:hypothetical protein
MATSTPVSALATPQHSASVRPRPHFAAAAVTSGVSTPTIAFRYFWASAFRPVSDAACGVGILGSLWRWARLS